MFDDLAHLRVFQVRKSDKEYKAVLEKRIQRLEQWKPKVARSKLKRGFNRCIILTAKGHELAEKVKSANIELLKTFPQDSPEAVERVLCFLEKGVQESAEIKERLKHEDVQLASAKRMEYREKSKTWLLEAIESKTEKDATLAEFLEARISGYDPLEQSSIKLDFVALFMGYRSYMNLIQASATIIELAELLRGFFYMGIVNITGRKLEEKVIRNDLTELAGELVGAVPGLAEITSTLKILKKLLETIQHFDSFEIPPTIVEEAQYIEDFISSYQAALGVWKIIANSLVSQNQGFVKLAKRYVS